MQLIWMKVLTQLGCRQTGLYALYQLGLKSGYLRWMTRSPKPSTATFQYSIPLPDAEELRLVLGSTGLADLSVEADEIASGKVRLFGSTLVDIDLTPPAPVKHWTLYRDLQLGDQQDIKFIWEPGRFGWAITLARAYLINRDERYVEAFWKYTEIFLDNNPAYVGVHWISAQEVALRLTALVFAFQIFETSTHSAPARISRLAESIVQHARRIPPSLSYARAQNNNHLLTEAMGLITAASVLPTHPLAEKWQLLGWKWFHKGLQTQIAADGSYSQHSTNYHRLMLQTALWVHGMTQAFGLSFPKLSMDRLAAATKWLLRLLDPISGNVPNLGPNDGANIFPLSVLPFHDFRPILQAAGESFLGEKVLPAGIWDEMGLWLCKRQQPPKLRTSQRAEEPSDKTKIVMTSPCVIKSSSDSWAYLRNAHFTSRPGHADQLHLDLWWRGINLTLDPGTYLYNAPAPWDNALTSTFVHNTVTINQQEQMVRAGRFLYLDWAQAEVCSQEYAQNGWVSCVIARHNGYQRLGIIHQRTIEACSEGWRIEDQLFPMKGKKIMEPIQARLHWLLPDWEWNLNTGETSVDLRLHSPLGWINTKISGRNHAGDLISASDLSMVLIRAGQVLVLNGIEDHTPHPTWGWVSPTYGAKIPALSFSILLSGLLPISFLTDWDLRTE